MIRFIDLRGQKTGYRFAFWDTISDCFLTFNDSQAWDTAEEFKEDCKEEGKSPERFLKLMPARFNFTEEEE